MKLEISEHSRHSHKKRKHEHISGDEASKCSVEQSEKSSLSEEHEEPFFIRTLCNSPESSQDSSKRGIFHIKVPITNHRRDPKSHASLFLKPNVFELPPVKQSGRDLSMACNQSEVQPHINRVTVVKPLVAAEQSVMAQRKGHPPGVPNQVSLQHPAKVIDRVDNVKQRPCPQAERKVMQRVEAAPARAMQRIDCLMPPMVIQGISPQLPPKALLQARSTVSPSQQDVEQPAMLQKPKAYTTAKEDPCFSGRSTEAGPVQEVQQSCSDRKSCKALKKERKFAELFVTWNPPPMQVEDTDVNDKEWLFCGKGRPDASTSNCRTGHGSAVYQSSEQLFSLQARGVHLPDLSIHQLPYVVPF